MKRLILSFAFVLAATPALAAISISKPEADPPPPKDPEQICVQVTNDGAAAEKIHLSLYDTQIPSGGAMPSNKAKLTLVDPTQEVTVPPKRTIRRGTITAEVGGSLRVCWKVKLISGRTFTAAAGNVLDKDGDVTVSSNDTSSFTAPVPKKKPSD